MKPINLRLALPLLFFLSLAPIASAFYDPSLGRWINRDPLGDAMSIPTERFAETRATAGELLTAYWTAPYEPIIGPNLHLFLANNPGNFIDPYGLSSIHAQVTSAVAQGDVCALESLLATGELTTAQTAAVQAAIAKYRSTAVQWICKNCKGSIAREFPSQLYNKTLEQIRNGTDAVSKKAWKLLNKSEFRK